MSEERDERWTHGSSFHIFRNASDVYHYYVDGAGFSVRLENLRDPPNQAVYASIQTPNTTEGWMVKSVMLRYKIESALSEFGLTGRIFKLALLDGEQVAWISDPLNYGMTTGFETIKLELLGPLTFRFGLNIEIDFGHDEYPPAHSWFYFASAGLEFVRRI